MSRIFPLALITLAAIVVVGVWLIISPFLLGTQPAGAAWISSTINAVAVGAILVATAIAGIVIRGTLGLHELVDAGQVASAHPAGPLAGVGSQAHGQPYPGGAPIFSREHDQPQPQGPPPEGAPLARTDAGERGMWRDDAYTHSAARRDIPQHASANAGSLE
jgi:hypothetical protein